MNGIYISTRAEKSNREQALPAGCLTLSAEAANHSAVLRFSPFYACCKVYYSTDNSLPFVHFANKINQVPRLTTYLYVISINIILKYKFFFHRDTCP